MGTPAKKPEYLFQFTEAELAEWWNYAACMDHPQADDWFAEGARGAEEASRAISLCNRCPVRTDCLAYAMGHPEVEGIWGGLTRPQRRQLAAGVSVVPAHRPGFCVKDLHDLSVHGRDKFKVNRDGVPVRNGVACRPCEVERVREIRARRRAS